MPTKKADRQALMLLGVLVCALLVWWAISRGAESGNGGSVAAPSSTSATSGTSSSSSAPATSGDAPATTPVSGLGTIAESRLPREARHTLDLIRAGGPYPYDADDGVFRNRERILPQQKQGYYREYTVETPGSDDRGARRIVGGKGGDRYYTDDHYDSFRQILEGE